MPPQALSDAHKRHFGFVGRSAAMVLGVVVFGAGSAVVFLHGWIGVLEALPALALGASAVYVGVVGREPRWWRSS
jgi:hypothetical protein